MLKSGNCVIDWIWKSKGSYKYCNGIFGYILFMVDFVVYMWFFNVNLYILLEVWFFCFNFCSWLWGYD